jgi:hypothetical protein
MDLYGIPIVIGLATLAIAGVLALTHPFENWRQVALRLLAVGGAMVVAGVIVKAIADR